jgi:hypothetical protein
MTSTPSLRTLAVDSLRSHDALVEHMHRQPRRTADDGAAWLAWAAERDRLTGARSAAVRALTGHPEYAAWHRRLWRDDVTVTTPAVYVWAPVARVVVAGRVAPRIE